MFSHLRHISYGLFAAAAATLFPALAGHAQAKINRPLVIAVDPGHGGRDPGAIGCHGAKEKIVTLAIARDLARRIDLTPRMRAVLTRTSDYYVGLRQRVRIAQRAGAELFISIHADAGNPSYHGATVYSQSPPDAPDVTQDQSEKLADGITRQLRRIEPVRRDRQADFVVLRSRRIPSVLVEAGFITNPEQERELTNRAFQRSIAAAIFGGIQRFLAGRLSRPSAVR